MSVGAMNYDFAHQQQEWSRPPVDDYAYKSSEELLQLPDQALRDLILKTQHIRYTGWRNHNNLWRECLGLDTTEGKRILDFGCGIGLEALQFAPKNDVIVADIVDPNVRLAQRVVGLFGYATTPAAIFGEAPFVDVGQVDIFYSNG